MAQTEQYDLNEHASWQLMIRLALLETSNLSTHILTKYLRAQLTVAVAFPVLPEDRTECWLLQYNPQNADGKVG